MNNERAFFAGLLIGIIVTALLWLISWSSPDKYVGEDRCKLEISHTLNSDGGVFSTRETWVCR